MTTYLWLLERRAHRRNVVGPVLLSLLRLSVLAVRAGVDRVHTAGGPDVGTGRSLPRVLLAWLQSLGT